MFKVLKNPEVKKEFIIYVAVSAVIGAGCFALSRIALNRNGLRADTVRIIGPAAGLCVFALGLIFALTHLVFSAKRYGRISALSESIDRILHDTDAALKTDNDEGELSVLVSEVQKMTVRLREQTDLLQADKIRLTDAIADIFHQIRTPLTSMNLIALTILMDTSRSGFTELLIARNKERYLSIVTLSALALNIVLALLLVKIAHCPFSNVILAAMVTYVLFSILISRAARKITGEGEKGWFLDLFPLRLFIPFVIAVIVSLIRQELLIFIPLLVFLLLNLRECRQIMYEVKRILLKPELVNL